MCSLLKPGSKKRAQVQSAMRRLNAAARACLAGRDCDDAKKLARLDRELEQSAAGFLKAKLGQIKAERARIMSVPKAEAKKAAEAALENLAVLESELLSSGVTGLVRDALRRAAET